MKREAVIFRETAETKVNLELSLDGQGKSLLQAQLPFLEHMLVLMTHHGSFDLKVEAKGDLKGEHHHLVEDLGLCLGQALRQAIGKKEGINRYGHIILPMDEALVLVAVDLSGRPHLSYDLPLLPGKLGELDVELVEEFLRAVVNEGKITLHVKKIAGYNRHHLVEALFKGLGRALKEATQKSDDQNNSIPSTKGVI